MDSTELYQVHVVVDPQFAQRLPDLPEGEPVWIVDTPENDFAIQECWRRRTGGGHLEGVTSFRYNPEGEPESWLIDELATIDLHHGEFSQNPPYSVLRVYGVRWTERVAAELLELGFHLIAEQDDGFTVQRADKPAAFDCVNGDLA